MKTRRDRRKIPSWKMGAKRIRGVSTPSHTIIPRVSLCALSTSALLYFKDNNIVFTAIKVDRIDVVESPHRYGRRRVNAYLL